MKTHALFSMLAITLAMLACSLGASQSGQTQTLDELQTAFDSLPVGDAARGEQIFLDQPCHTCHVKLQVGPAFPGEPPLAVRAETRKPGYSASLYLYESIVRPNADIVPGFQQDIMPGDISETLTDQEVADLLAYLMTMK